MLRDIEMIAKSAISLARIGLDQKTAPDPSITLKILSIELRASMTGFEDRTKRAGVDQ